MQSLTAQNIVKILAKEMSLPANSIWIRDQNRLIPNDNGLYIVVGMVNAVTIGARSLMKTNDALQQVEAQEVNQRETIQIDILSRSNDALTRNWEVIAALNSIYSKQVQEAGFFKIFRIPSSFLNVSIAEGGSQLNRYSVTFPVFVWYRKTKVLTPDGGNYFDDFATRVDDEKTIGTDKPLIEFEITAS